MAYLSSAFLMSVDVGKNDGHTCVEVNKPYPNLPEEWVGIIDKELHQYLKSPSFNGSLADYFNWFVKFFELTKGLPYPASAFISGLAKYWSEVPRLFRVTRNAAPDSTPN